MAGDYRVILEIRVDRGDPKLGVIAEEKIYKDLTFAKMTRVSAEFYELLPKLEKEIK